MSVGDVFGLVHLWIGDVWWQKCDVPRLVWYWYAYIVGYFWSLVVLLVLASPLPSFIWCIAMLFWTSSSREHHKRIIQFVFNNQSVIVWLFDIHIDCKHVLNVYHSTGNLHLSRMCSYANWVIHCNSIIMWYIIDHDHYLSRCVSFVFYLRTRWYPEVRLYTDYPL